MPLTPARGRQKQVDLCEVKNSQAYTVSSWTVRTTQRYPVSKTENQPSKHKSTTLEAILRDSHYMIQLDAYIKEGLSIPR